MTSQNFDARYQLLKCVAVADGIRTHNAIELVTGRVVMVHLVDAAGPDEVEALQRRLGRLPQTEKARVLEIATLPAGFAVVTEFLQGMGSFPEWLAARVPDDSVELPSQVPAGASQWPIQRVTEPVTPFAAEFTSGDATQDGVSVVPPIPPAKEVSTLEVPRQTATAESLPVVPGFVTPVAPWPVAPPVVASVAPLPVTSPPVAPLPVTPPPVAPQAPAKPAGDFTRMFGAPTNPATPVPSAPTPVPPLVPALPPAPPPFVPPVVLQSPPPVALPVAPPLSPAPSVPLPAVPHAAPVVGEGEFTRMFRGPAPAMPTKPKDDVRSPFVASPPPPAPPIVAAPLAPPALPPAKAAASVDELFGTLPPASSLPPVAMPYAPPIPVRQNAPPASPFGSPPSAAPSGRQGGLGASPIGNPSANVPPLNLPPFGRSQPTPPPLSSGPGASTPVPSTLGSPIPGSPLGLPSLPSLPPLPPPAENAPMFPGGGAGNAVSPLGAGRATPASRGGVYTEMIQRSVTPPPVVAIEKKPAANVPARKKNIPLGLIIALNAVLILAVILIAYFVFRPKKAPDGGDGTTPTETAPADSAAKKSGTMPKLPEAPKVPTVTKPTIPTVPKLP
jgi:hypothetical protein